MNKDARTATEEIIYRRITQRHDRSGRGCFASMHTVGRGETPSEPNFSLSHTRRIVRRLRLREEILFAGQTATGHNIYLHPERTYQSDRVPFSTTRPIHHLWSTDAAAALLKVPLPKPQDFVVQGVHIPYSIVSQFSERVVREAVERYKATYNVETGRMAKSPTAVLASICRSITAAGRPDLIKRRSEQTKQQDLRTWQAMGPEERAAFDDLLGVSRRGDAPASSDIGPAIALDTVSDTCARYLRYQEVIGRRAGTLRYDKAKLKAVCDVLGKRSANSLSQADLTAYTEARVKGGGDAGGRRQTVKRELKVLVSVLRYVGLGGRITPEMHKFLRDIQQERPRSGNPLTYQEYLAVRGKLQPKRQAYLDLGVFTGARRSEIEALRVNHVDVERQQLHVPGTKTDGSDRVIPLPPVVAELAKQRGAGKLVDKWLNVLRELKGACERAGIAPRNVNDLRHTFCTWLKEAGVDDQAVSKLMGHEGTDMVVSVYTHLTPDHLRRAMEHLAGAGFSTAGRRKPPG